LLGQKLPALADAQPEGARHVVAMANDFDRFEPERRERGALAAPVLSFNGLTFVNPFNPFWFASAGMRAGQLLARFPDHEKKYSWFLKLCEAIERDELLVPEPTMAELLRLGILERRDSPPPLASKVDVA